MLWNLLCPESGEESTMDFLLDFWLVHVGGVDFFETMKGKILMI